MTHPTIKAMQDEILALHPKLEGQPAPEPDSELLQRVMTDRVVLENLPEIICVLDRQLTIMYLSRTVPTYSLPQMFGTRASDYVVPEYRVEFCQAFEHAWASREPQTLDFASMSGRSWRTRFVPKLRDGATQYVLASTLETTEQVRATRERDSRLRHAIDVVGMGTWTHQWQSDNTLWDDALCAIYGLRPGEAPHTFGDFLGLVHPDDRERVRLVFVDGSETGEYAELEYRIVRPSGELRHVHAKGSSFDDPLGAAGMLVAVFDVTDRKRLESQLYQRQKLEAMGELTAGIAHNFNNLLSVILPNVELCMLDAPPALHRRLADIEHATQRAADLVRRLMVFTRNDAALDKVPLDPAATLRRTLEIARTTFDRIIGIELQIGANIPHLLANAAELEQVLLNICINARDALQDAHTPAPKIAVTLDRTPAGAARIRITDNGPGMDEATRARVFEPFFTTKEVGRGTGLGLASAYAIIRDHAGRLSCESTPGAGTTFEIELPGLTRQAMIATSPAARAKPWSGSDAVLLNGDERQAVS